MVHAANRPATAAPDRGGWTRGRIGPLTVDVAGDRPLASALMLELTTSPTDGAWAPADLEVVFGPRAEFMAGYLPTTFSAKTHMSFNDDEFSADEPVRFLASRLFDAERGCRLAIDDRSERLLRSMRRRLGPEVGAHPVLSYSLFWNIVHVRLLHRGASSIHAGVVEVDGRATAIVGTGGSGKTSLLFALLDRPRARYLAEDLGIIDRDGVVHLSPKAISIYASDVAAGPLGLDAFVRSRGIDERARWTVHRRVLGTVPMVKAPLGSILPASRIGTTARLDRIVYLIRRSIDRVQVYDASAEELATRLTDVAWREHKRLLELVRMIRANADVTTRVPTVEQLTAMTHETLAAGIGDAARYRVEVPAGMGAGDILDALRRDGVID